VEIDPRLGECIHGCTSHSSPASHPLPTTKKVDVDVAPKGRLENIYKYFPKEQNKIKSNLDLTLVAFGLSSSCPKWGLDNTATHAACVVAHHSFLQAGSHIRTLCHFLSLFGPLNPKPKDLGAKIWGCHKGCHCWF
jgi:hypothetical protein